MLALKNNQKENGTVQIVQQQEIAGEANEADRRIRSMLKCLNVYSNILNIFIKGRFFS